MTLRANDVIDGYLHRFPGAREAYLQDARFHAETAVARRLLYLVDMAMEDERVPEEIRLRVLRTAVYGTADPEAAMRREAEYEQAKQEFIRSSAEPGWPGPVKPMG